MSRWCTATGSLVTVLTVKAVPSDGDGSFSLISFDSTYKGFSWTHLYHPYSCLTDFLLKFLSPMKFFILFSYLTEHVLMNKKILQ